MGQFSEGFKALGQGRIFGVIPIPVLIMVLVAIFVFIVLSRTKYGRTFYAIGGNAEAARLVGASVNRYTMMAYMASGLIAPSPGFS